MAGEERENSNSLGTGSHIGKGTRGLIAGGETVEQNQTKEAET